MTTGMLIVMSRMMIMHEQASTQCRVEGNAPVVNWPAVYPLKKYLSFQTESIKCLAGDRLSDHYIPSS